MSKSHRLIDSDSHILEPPDLFEKYLEPRFRSSIRCLRREQAQDHVG